MSEMHGKAFLAKWKSKMIENNLAGFIQILGLILALNSFGYKEVMHQHRTACDGEFWQCLRKEYVFKINKALT